MILLDTDHLTVLGFPGTAKYALLKGRIDGRPDQSFATTVVTAEEQVRGLLALIARAHDVRDQIPPYDRLAWLFDFFRRCPIVPLDLAGADEFDQLRRARVRIGTRDLKIASIALANGALLLSANLRDFRKVPGLKVEDWLA